MCVRRLQKYSKTQVSVEEKLPDVGNLCPRDPIPCDKSGVISGCDAALVIDAGINGAIAREIQRIAANVTDRPQESSLYLADGRPVTICLDYLP
jgi:hypothetical protein